MLPLYAANEVVLVAVGALPALGLGRAAEREATRLQKWAQAVCDRLRLTDQAAGRRRSEEEQTLQAASAWEGLLVLDHAIRRLRVYKEPERNRQRLLDAARELLGAETIVWVPHQADGPVQVRGKAGLAPADYRQLVHLLAHGPNHQPGEPLLCNDVASCSWSGRYPTVSNLLAYQVADQSPLGWVLAFNKQKTAAKPGTASEPGLASFRRADAILLGPFCALLELQGRTSARYQDLKELLVGLTRSLTSALDAKDSYTYGHSERVARIAVELGRELGMQGDELSDIYLAGLLHDVGKIGVRDAVLSKTEPLTPQEFEHIKQHVTIGYAILADLRPIRNLLPGVLYHHERIDGKGYPDGLAGDAIPLLARILAVADAYDAMSTTRPYRQAMPCPKVEQILMEGAGKQWDKRVIEAFARCRHKIHTIRQRGVGESLQQALDGALRIDRSLMVSVDGDKNEVGGRS